MCRELGCRGAGLGRVPASDNGIRSLVCNKFLSFEIERRVLVVGGVGVRIAPYPRRQDLWRGIAFARARLSL